MTKYNLDVNIAINVLHMILNLSANDSVNIFSFCFFNLFLEFFYFSIFSDLYVTVASYRNFFQQIIQVLKVINARVSQSFDKNCCKIFVIKIRAHFFYIITMLFNMFFFFPAVQQFQCLEKKNLLHEKLPAP